MANAINQPQEVHLDNGKPCSGAEPGISEKFSQLMKKEQDEIDGIAAEELNMIIASSQNTEWAEMMAKTDVNEEFVQTIAGDSQESF